jgi:asparagine synthase (glutamine-hydrolysing)
MCGITMIWDPLAMYTDDLCRVVKGMTNEINHRGPDNNNIWHDNESNVCLGHARLSINDLSHAGDQPMHSLCKRWHIVFNGEIYNHLEIRRELNKTNSRIVWNGSSDTETLLNAISAWGVEKTVSKCVGMFAFVVWDGKLKLASLCRDRVGEKPLYYSVKRNTLIVSSEIKAIKKYALFDLDINYSSVVEVLGTNYISDSNSIYKNIIKLAPGSILTLKKKDIINGNCGSLLQYWSFDNLININPFEGSFNEAVDIIDNMLCNIIKDQLKTSDVKVGSFLSGGIDSSLVTAIMNTHSNDMESYTAAIKGSSLNEAHHAHSVANFLNIKNKTINISAPDMIKYISKIYNTWDEPFADSSQLPTLMISEFASKYTSVVITGDGADESFFGYNHYSWIEKLWKYRLLANASCKVLKKIPHLKDEWIPKSLYSIYNSGIVDLAASESKYELVKRSRNNYRNFNFPLSGKSIKDFKYLYEERSEVIDKLELLDPSIVGSYYDSTSYLPDDIMTKVDRASMRYSLETRSPFLNHNLIEFSWSLPLNYKLGSDGTKHILKKVLGRYLPRELFIRKKQGFSVPMDSWLRSELHEWASDLLTNESLEGNGFRCNDVKQLWSLHNKGYNNSKKLWPILMLQQFFKESK